MSQIEVGQPQNSSSQEDKPALAASNGQNDNHISEDEKENKISSADVVFIIEATANLGAYIDVLKTNYIIPTLEYFCGYSLGEKSYVGDVGCSDALFALVAYHTASSAPEPASVCIGPTSSARKLLLWIDTLRFVGGGAENLGHMTEGLASALQIFDDFQLIGQSAKSDDNRNVSDGMDKKSLSVSISSNQIAGTSSDGCDDKEINNDSSGKQKTTEDSLNANTTSTPKVNRNKHCILICNSPPYQTPCIESPSYFGLTLDYIVSSMRDRRISLSVIAPRKMSFFFQLFERAGGNSQSAMSKHYAKDARHLVLLSNYQLEESPITPPVLDPPVLMSNQVTSVQPSLAIQQQQSQQQQQQQLQLAQPQPDHSLPDQQPAQQAIMSEPNNIPPRNMMQISRTAPMQPPQSPAQQQIHQSRIPQSPLQMQQSSPVQLQQQSPLAMQQQSPLPMQQPSPAPIQQPSPLQMQQPSPLQIQQPSPQQTILTNSQPQQISLPNQQHPHVPADQISDQHQNNQVQSQQMNSTAYVKSPNVMVITKKDEFDGPKRPLEAPIEPPQKVSLYKTTFDSHKDQSMAFGSPANAVQSPSMQHPQSPLLHHHSPVQHQMSQTSQQQPRAQQQMSTYQVMPQNTTHQSALSMQQQQLPPQHLQQRQQQQQQQQSQQHQQQHQQSQQHPQQHLHPQQQPQQHAHPQHQQQHQHQHQHQHQQPHATHQQMTQSPQNQSQTQQSPIPIQQTSSGQQVIVQQANVPISMTNIGGNYYQVGILSTAF